MIGEIRMFLGLLCLILLSSCVLADSTPCELGDMTDCQCVDYARKNKVTVVSLINRGRLVEAADILEGILMRCPDQEDVLRDYSALLSKGQEYTGILFQDNPVDVSQPDWFWRKRIGVSGGDRKSVV